MKEAFFAKGPRGARPGEGSSVERIQKFVYKGVRSVAREQGVVWPR